MSNLKLPVRPDLQQLKIQAKELLKRFREGDIEAIALFKSHRPRITDDRKAKLADAQHVMALAYGAPNWARLAVACRLVDAIWENDVATVRELITKQPTLIHEDALIRKSNWGRPMSYAANVGRDEIIRLLHHAGATDHVFARDRATLQGKIATARMLHHLMGEPAVPSHVLGGPAYTLSVTGTALMFEFGAKVHDENGKPIAPVDVVLESDSRKPAAKHAILEMYANHGLVLPDTPIMALHRGRIDLLEKYLRNDPALLRRTFAYREIYPPEVGCNPENQTVHGTPLDGATLLHLCVDYDEIEIARWLLSHGMDANVRAAIDTDGFGGHTPLFSAVVSYPNWWRNYQHREDDTAFTRLLLENGADVGARASLRKELKIAGNSAVYAYQNVTALEWGRQFADRLYVSNSAVRLLEARE